MNVHIICQPVSITASPALRVVGGGCCGAKPRTGRIFIVGYVACLMCAKINILTIYKILLRHSSSVSFRFFSNCSQFS